MDQRSFLDLIKSEEIVKALDYLKYEEPTKVQVNVIPLALNRNDIIVKAQTGSGKTAAYAIPICELIDWYENKPQALILTPTRELAVQVKDDFINIGRFKRVKATEVYGRHQFSIEKAELKQKTHVVVGTPGRIMDHIQKGTLNLTKINCVVIDEADRMLDMGFESQVEAIMKELPQQRMTMLFSATMPEKVISIASNYMQDPIHIDVSESSIMPADINHFLYITEENDKFELLTDVMIMEKPDSCIIFCNTKDQVDLVCDQLNDLGYRSNKIHGGMEQRDRLSAMKSFKRGEVRFLVATDVAARGIDIENISLVINYDIPLDEENYVHRTGRTGRAGLKGKAISFVVSSQTRYLHDIEKLIGYEVREMIKPTKEEVSIQKPFFDAKMNTAPKMKELKSNELNKDIMKLRFNGGKKKKLRATNFVGVISNIEGVGAEDIGIIAIQDTLTYVEILNGKGSLVLEALNNTMIGGKLPRATKAVDRN